MTYNAIKKIIESGRFDTGDMLQKLDIFLLGNRITQEQYGELAGFLSEELDVHDEGDDPTEPDNPEEAIGDDDGDN